MAKKKPKSTNIEYNRRVEYVMELLKLKNYTRTQIFRYISENTEWNVTQRQIENYMAEANARLIEDFNNSTQREKIITKIYNRLEDIYERADDMEDLNTMRGVLKDYREVFGIDAPKTTENKTEITQKTVQPIEVKVIEAKYTHENRDEKK